MNQKNKNMLTAFYNGRIYTGNKVLENMAVLTGNGIVIDVVEAAAVPDDFSKVDLGGKCLAPSFIDLQIYGGNGKLFSHEVTIDALEATYGYCRGGGAGHFMITMATNSSEKIRQGIQAVRDYWSAGKKGLLGLHLEGPYINPVKKGAHIEEFIRRPVLEEVRALLEEGEGIIKMMTLAPECCGGDVISFLLEKGILVSAGHSNATYQQAQSAFNLGIKTATHLFNAMSPFQSREPGMVGAIFDHGSIMSSVICDGIHVDFAAVRISKKLMGSRLFLITDAVTATESGEYQHVYRNDHYTLPDGTLSGSALTMVQSVQNAKAHIGVSMEEAICMASTYPANLLDSRYKLGRIEKGFEASFIIFDEDWNTWKLWQEQ